MEDKLECINTSTVNPLTGEDDGEKWEVAKRRQEEFVGFDEKLEELLNYCWKCFYRSGEESWKKRAEYIERVIWLF